MSSLPDSLEAATAQAREATRAAIKDGIPRMMVELVYPELKVMPVAEQFYPVLQEIGLTFKMYFPDAGAAALARRDWQDPDFVVRGIGELQGQMEADDQAYLFIEPSSVEVTQVEEMCNQAADRFVIMLNPRLEDVATVGIGYAGRQLRERFLSQLESVYYLRPMSGAVLYRCYPFPWQIWQETSDGNYELLAELPQKPSGEAIDRLLLGEVLNEDATGEPARSTPVRRGGFLSELQSFIRALTQ